GPAPARCAWARRWPPGARRPGAPAPAHPAPAPPGPGTAADTRPAAERPPPTPPPAAGARARSRRQERCRRARAIPSLADGPLLFLHGHESGRRVVSLAEEVLLGMLHEQFLPVRRRDVQTVFVHDHLRELDPLL